MGEADTRPGERDVRIPVGDAVVEASLTVPAGARGIVVFAHGTGSSRRSPRNRAVAAYLQRAGYATLLMDLLTLDEEREEAVSRHHRFNLRMLAERLIHATDWLSDAEETRRLAVGYFGASTGAGAALIAASERPAVRAVVSRGGRADLAGEALPRVQAPTLLIVGAEDGPVVTLNQKAMREMVGPREMVSIPGATHLFEEPGALEEVCRLARDWFDRNLSGEASRDQPQRSA